MGLIFTIIMWLEAQEAGKKLANEAWGESSSGCLAADLAHICQTANSTNGNHLIVGQNTIL